MRVRWQWGVACLGLLLCPLLVAKNLGTLGPVYSIKEPDLLVAIQQRLATLKAQGRLSTLKQQFVRQVNQHSVRPKAVTGLTLTQVKKQWLFDPSIVVAKDIVTPKGQEIAHQGQHFNPLHWVTLRYPLVFINGDHQHSLTLARSLLQQSPNAKVILVKGNVKQVMKALHHRVYFDQGGSLSRHFHLRHVPSVIRQQGLKLQVTEVVA